jgi:nucleotide-binding universal stress UspA family protein
MEREVHTARIVVGIDGSNPSECALRWAAQEAAGRGDALDVVHAWRVPYAMHPNAHFVDAAIFKDRAVDTLDDAIDSLSTIDPAPSDVRGVLAEDDAATALVTAAEGAGLLVVGSRGRGGFVGLLLGSVSQRCVDHAPCPVAVIPSTWDGATHGRIVVGIDGSEASHGALHWAVAEAVRRDACLDVVNAYGFHQYISPFGRTAPIDRDQLEESSRALLEEMVEGAVGRFGSRPPAVELIATPMSPVLALLDTSKGADLLVVGSHGHGVFRGMLTGSVSLQCVHHAHCAVVVVRPPRTSQPDRTNGSYSAGRRGARLVPDDRSEGGLR